MNGTNNGLISFPCPVSEEEIYVNEIAIYEQANASKSRTISWSLGLFMPRLVQTEGAQMEKPLTPSCLEFIKERLTAMGDIGVKNFR